ncbi:glycosyltransferase family 4 protein [Halorubrum ezzemoulense]|uniref:glycosyltransferase family 4 protein n=1 Tax=Halorubrum ezzemoulense TaxID=337243 RepID=UPI00232EB662|nr:glycosyltransferase family 4 protein [Halorubrum ezzemoulense]MDB9300325.1 glycosyltransferase family 4 protein [Halorubrum ezzemoulense]
MYWGRYKVVLVTRNWRCNRFGDLNGIESAEMLFLDPSLEIIKSGTEFKTPYGSVGREIVAASSHLENIYVCGPTRTGESQNDMFRFDRKSINLIHLPHWIDGGNKRGFLKNLHSIGLPVTKQLSTALDRVDIAWIRTGNHPVSIIAQGIATMKNTPTAYSIGADIAETTEYRTNQSTSITSYLKQFTAHGLKKGARIAASQSDCVLVHKGPLEDEYSDLDNSHGMFISTVSESDIVETPTISQEDPFKILYVGRLSREKGIDVLIDAVSKINTDLKIELSIIGDGPERSSLHQRSKDQSIEDIVTFHGYVPFDSELLRKYRSYDLFILPSRSEGQGRVLLEAMAAGVPIIASDVGGIPAVIRHNETGLLVPPDDSEALKIAILSLLDDPSLRFRFATNALSWIEEHTIESEVKHVIDLIESDILCTNNY